MKRTDYLAVFLALVIGLCVSALPSFGQAQQPQLKTQKEYDGYVAIFNEKDPAKKGPLGEKFIAEFPDSQGVPNAYQMTIGAYSAAKNWAKVIEVADKATALAGATPQLKAYANANAMIAAQNMNNMDKVISYGDKVLAIDPNDLNTLLMLSAIIPQKLPSDDAGKKASLDRASDLANKALAGVKELQGKAKPEEKPQLDQIEGNLHATLGLVAYNRPDTAKSIQEYELAIQKTPKDEISHYYLALDYQSLAAKASKDYQETVAAENAAKAKKEEQPVIDEIVAKRTGLGDDVAKYRDKTIEEFAITVAIGGQLTAQAKDALTKMWMGKNDSTNGLEEFIAQKKAELK
jgi:tetratricopeptide (TPR) repeat protein